MEQAHHPKNGLSYANLFNLESLMNFRIPQGGDDFDNYGSSSQDESRGRAAMVDMTRRKRHFVKTEPGSNSSARRDVDSNEEDHSDDFVTHVSEERYRAMLGEHVQKYRRVRFKDSSSLSPAHARTGMLATKRNHSSSKGRKLDESVVSVKEDKVFHGMETPSDFFADINPSKQGNYFDTDFGSEYCSERFLSSFEAANLDIGEGVTYRIPPTYDKLASLLRLPSLSDIRINEQILKGALDLGTLSSLMAGDRRQGFRSHMGMGDPTPEFESLQAKLKALAASNSGPKFNLQVLDNALDLSIPEGAAGGRKRSIMSEGGTLQIIRRSLPKKQKVKKDPALIEKEEKEKIAKFWVRMKANRSCRFSRGAAVRTKKSTRDMQVFWKRMDKELAEIKKREEKEAAEALKREEELREAKRQQQRLNFLLSQTELYSHFMQNKSASASEILPEEESNDAELPHGSEKVLVEEEDPEEAALKREALRAAQAAVSQQKKITSAFDDECMKLRQAVETEGQQSENSIAGSSNIDLLHPSTMPVASSVQTPELFKGSLKEYQLKGLQWLVNCYEQGLNGILADEMGLGKTIQAMAFLAHLAENIMVRTFEASFLGSPPPLASRLICGVRVVPLCTQMARPSRWMDAIHKSREKNVLNNWADEISRFCPDLKTLPYWGGLQERTILRKNINPKRLYRRESGFHILITSYQLLVSDEKYFRRVKWQYMHAVLKPFMLRRVKKDVISEMTGKTEVTVHCKLSSRQQVLYQAIKNKISISGLFDGTRSISEKKLLNLMNIVIQLRKVCNHPELFERNEGSTYLYFGDILNPLLPPPFGELEDVYYAGGWNPIIYKIPKLVYQDVVRSSELPCSVDFHGIEGKSLVKLFHIFSPENVHHSILPKDGWSDDTVVNSGTFGFTRLTDLSPEEVAFLAEGSSFEKLLFSVMRWDRRFLDDILDLFMETEGDDLKYDHVDKGTVRAVTRMLLLPTKSELSVLRRKLVEGPGDSPYEELVVSHKDRLTANIKLLNSTYAFIPRSRAPPISAHCSDRSFSYRMLEELHHPWLKRMLLGFARTSEHNGPIMPNGPHHLIQEIDSELPAAEPVLQLTYKIFGSSPPVRSFDPARMLTDSGKLQTLDILLKRLRPENHRVLLFAQMTKMLNILEDYMNYRKYRYLRLDGSSTIMDRRDMVRDFQHR
ncbi:hypothetical protein ACLOJK_000382 [Asimina triloba]